MEKDKNNDGNCFFSPSSLGLVNIEERDEFK